MKRLAKGKIGVGTLMTIAAVGAVVLGEVGEAAMLAFLFSISEDWRNTRSPVLAAGCAPVVAGAQRGHRAA
ncbi:hypothetical protein MARA_03940 [Mycolicibacterium arabiense]|uniref:Uncharacterized protein n=1 Tax=Mycolicibacterium arabiense TaxID=1286181 RepID=A0A7I7RSC7_9MYCO|nr:hypothetical protein MARA_03940 [Mycolicibacterium arabiense]